MASLNDMTHRHPVSHGLLQVVQGPQSGASHRLSLNETLLIGHTLEHDIVLRDDTLQGVSIQLTIETRGMNVTLLSGTCRLNEESLSAEDHRKISSEARLQLGSSLLQISVVRDGRCVEPDREQETPVVSAPELRHELSGSVMRSSAALKTFAGLLVAALLGLTISTSGAWTDQGQPERTPPALAERLAEQGFASLHVDMAEHVFVVSGFLPTHEEALRLDALLRSAPGEIRNRVRVGERQAERVRDVFRLNGVDAEVTVGQAGDVKVETRYADEVALAAIVERVKRDVAGLSNLRVTNRPPEPPASSQVPSRSVPGKRVAMVISDPPAHVITEDRARYFIGSVLPSGHRISRIEAGTVVLVKAGRTTELEF